MKEFNLITGIRSTRASHRWKTVCLLLLYCERSSHQWDETRQERAGVSRTYNLNFWDNSVYVSIGYDGKIWTNANVLSFVTKEVVVTNDGYPRLYYQEYQDVTMNISLDGKTGDITF